MHSTAACIWLACAFKLWQCPQNVFAKKEKQQGKGSLIARLRALVTLAANWSLCHFLHLPCWERRFFCQVARSRNICNTKRQTNELKTAAVKDAGINSSKSKEKVCVQNYQCHLSQRQKSKKSSLGWLWRTFTYAEAAIDIVRELDSCVTITFSASSSSRS